MTVITSVAIEEKLYDRMQELKRKHGSSLGFQINSALKEWLEKEGR